MVERHTRWSIPKIQMNISYCRVYRKDHGIKVGEMVLMVKAYLPIAFHIRLTK